MLFFSLLLLNIFPPIVEFFPDNEPRQILVYVEYPEGTDINKTNSTSILIENEIYNVVNLNNENEDSDGKQEKKEQDENQKNPVTFPGFQLYRFFS